MVGEFSSKESTIILGGLFDFADKLGGAQNLKRWAEGTLFIRLKGQEANAYAWIISPLPFVSRVFFPDTMFTQDDIGAKGTVVHELAHRADMLASFPPTSPLNTHVPKDGLRGIFASKSASELLPDQDRSLTAYSKKILKNIGQRQLQYGCMARNMTIREIPLQYNKKSSFIVFSEGIMPHKKTLMIPSFIFGIMLLFTSCMSPPEQSMFNYCQWYKRHDFVNLSFGVMTKQEMIDWLEAQGISEFYDEKPNRIYETGVSWRNEGAYFIAWFHQNRLAVITATHSKAKGSEIVECLNAPDYYSTIPFRGPEGSGWSIVLWYPEKGMALEGFIHEKTIKGDEITFSETYFFKPNNIDDVVRDQVLIVPEWVGQPLEDILPHVKPWPGDFSQIQ